MNGNGGSGGFEVLSRGKTEVYGRPRLAFEADTTKIVYGSRI